ncbi:ATP synthase F1 subunit gamma [Sodaliphilus pleomorphus]|jgi:F-type H+-transporting ATPase subunit gamma|uniref:ATP synthase gamma chain n=1 Tax=Sodaliphilus pleomorphus TaxID=2606626 RepID=A0A6L5XDY0_9BACT|nr:ATP synthase F1 subunit gamma [Sodaliphilus pleomorphus]MCI5979940.1 ATP synthase F1 subunit gamma [Muribaculaceae bacterium]MCI6169043.1 ATP synthase F1 subunit gamma [Muribaculaceae bacterium]MDY6252266.1 ATP synthase F1 subunit gamma [Bacteroidales bacterium]MSS17947.1 ATP synthase F1 subunit gamma [Sodaliphilus pleomorphus]
MSTLRELKTRIGSVSSTEKTTSAMKMISSAKMHKYTAQVQRMLPYRNMVQSVLGHLLATDGEFSSPLITTREVSKVAIVVFGSDDGLCGAYNVNILKSLMSTVKKVRDELGNDVAITVIPVGKKIVKAVQHVKDAGFAVETVDYINTRSTVDQLHDFTAMLLRRFLDKECDRVLLQYMHFVSTSRQRPACDQMLPVSYQALEQAADKQAANSPCLFEPDANSIFNSVLPLYIRSMMQEVFTEASASEQATRVMAMQTASDNAKDLLDDLNLEYNKLRQQSITTELLDIIGGQVER